MAKQWEYDFANRLKGLGGTTSPVITVGEVVSVNPFKGIIQNGTYQLNSNNTMACESAIASVYELNFHGTVNVHENPISADGKAILRDPLKVGDIILVISDPTGQQYYIIDRLQEV